MNYYYTEFNIFGTSLKIEFFSKALQIALSQIQKEINDKNYENAQNLVNAAIDKFDLVPDLIKFSTLISFLTEE